MNESIVLESQKPIQFEPYCIRCGCKTKGRYYLDNQGMVVAVASTFIPFFELVKILNPGNIWVPLCYKCKFHNFFPNKKAWSSILVFLICLGLGVYLFICEMWQFGLLFFAAAIYLLFYISKQNRVYVSEKLPVNMKQEKDKIVYVFTSGHYYNTLYQQMDNESRNGWESDFKFE